MQVTFMTTAEHVAAQFDQAAPLLQPVVDQAARGEFTVQDLRRLTAEGRAITMLVSGADGPTGAMVFEVVMYPSLTAVNIMALGGSGFAEGEALLGDSFRNWCRAAGATMIEASCSPGMARMLRRYGFDVVYQVVRAAI